MSSIKGVGALLQESWNLTIKNFKTFALIVTIILIPLLTYFIGFGIMAAAGDYEWLSALGILIAAVGYVAMIILSFWAQIAFIEASDSFSDHKKYKLRDVFSFETWSLVAQLFLAGMIFGVLVVLGGLFFIIPGILFFVWFIFYQYSVILDRKFDLYSLQHSYHLVKGRWWSVLWRFLAFAVIMMVCIGVAMGIIFGFMALLGSFVPIIGTIITVLLFVIFYAAILYLVSPLSNLYFVLMYKDLKKTAK